jgi:transcriptional regulator with XRE-family HTH domain
MDGTGSRLRALREKSGLEAETLADQIGVSPLWYEDLENEPGEVEESLGLEQIRKLSLLLGVGVAHLLTGAPVPPGIRVLSFLDLARQIRRKLEDMPGLDELEEKVGWDLGRFLKSPETEGWEQRIPFFKDVCAALDLDWLGVIAYLEILPES